LGAFLRAQPHYVLLDGAAERETLSRSLVGNADGPAPLIKIVT
jgi:hypothetical protein